MSATTISWVPLPGADVSSYRLYRSMIGFAAAKASPADLEGLTLILAFNGTTAQGITFSGTDSAVNQINAQITGGRAYDAADPQADYFFVRSNIRTNPGSVEIVDGTAMVLLSIQPHFINERSEAILLDTILALPDPTATLTYNDEDGVSDDFYAISVINHLGDESLKSMWRQAVTTGGNVCVLEGIVSDMTGRRIIDTRVQATICGTPQGSPAQVSRRPLVTLTGPDGRYSFAVLQGLFLRIDIPEIGFSRVVQVPALKFANVADLPADDSPQLQMDNNLGVL